MRVERIPDLPSLETSELTSHGRVEDLAIVRNIVPPHVTCVYICRAEALGLVHALACPGFPAAGDRASIEAEGIGRLTNWEEMA